MRLQHCAQMRGTLRCHQIDALPDGKAPSFGIVLCHGYGAPGTDLLSFSEELLNLKPELAENVQFLFPEAPLSLADMGMPGGRAWWPVSLQKLQAQLGGGGFQEIREAAPEGLEAARTALVTAIESWAKEVGLSWTQILLGGFSQGAMVTTEVAASISSTPAGLMVLSGALIHEGAWKTGFAKKAGLPIFQSHGTYDTVLPFVTGSWLKELFEAAGAKLQFMSFPGPHTISYEVLEELADFIHAQAIKTP